MDTRLALIVLFYFVSCTIAAFQDEMAALEKDMAKADSSQKEDIKKSIKDLSTEELIAELEREFHGSKSDSKSDVTMEKKFRQRFEDIINKKAKLDELANVDMSSLLSDEKKDNKDALTGIIDALDEALTEKNKEKKELIDGECKDLRSDCKVLVNYCTTHKKKLEKACAKTCGYCVDCKQRIPKIVCDNLKKSGKCDTPDEHTRNRMTRLCPLTCGYCRLPSPPKCSDTTHGCCWDKITTKKNSKGTNCPVCKNEYKFVCKTFKPDCESYLRPGDFMRQFCPKACGLCEGKCRDDKEKALLCPFWKDTLKWCKEKESVMRVYCPKTCNLC